MKFTANGETVEFDESRMLFAEARAIESVTGMTVKAMFEALTDGSATALQALVWVAFKRKNPALKFSDLDTWDINDLGVGDEVPDEEGDDTESDDADPLVEPASVTG